MKNKTLMAIAVTGLALAACKKDRTCECITTSTYAYTTDNNGNTTTATGSDGPDTTTIVFKKMKKSDLKTICGDNDDKSSSTGQYGNSSQSNTSTSETKCKLK